MIKVLLAEDHTLVRKGIRSLLENHKDIDVLGEAQDGREAVQLAEEIQPDVILMDLSMPNLNGLEATRQIHRQFPNIRIIMLTMHADEEYIYQTFKAGASGYLVKRAGFSELITAIRAVAKGDSYLSPAISKTVIEEYINNAENSRGETLLDKLTEREREVFQLIVEGLSNKMVSERLNISVKTVETHKAKLMSKLGVSTTVDLVKHAVRHRIIDIT